MTRTTPLYRDVAHRIEEMIVGGVYEPGERLPSIRDLHREFGISVNTAREVYRLLDDRGIAEPRHHSGHFVRSIPRVCGDCDMDFPDAAAALPQDVSPGHLVGRVLADGERAHWLNLATAEPPGELLPMQRLAQLTARVIRTEARRAVSYDMPPGPEALRIEIARRAFRGGVTASPDQVLVTAGCLEAVFLSLMSVCAPGDAVIIESPGFFLFYQLLERLRLKVVEIPSRPSEGVDPAELDQILTENQARHRAGAGPRVAAVLLIANFSNPIGSLMSVERKRAVASVLARHEVVLIEDDMYGEMAWDVERPPSLASFTNPERTLVCASFSKSIAPGFRIGWVIAGSDLIREVTHAKLVTSAAVSSPAALGIAAYLASGGYDRWLRSARRHYRESVARVRSRILETFPERTQVTNPAGGMVVWAVLPPEIDTVALYDTLRPERIAFSPGAMFTLGKNYRNCLRVNATTWNSEVADALATIGSGARRLYRAA